ncbi:hypothetical protein L3X38_007390 [Prunus dulcis]|uniref:Uncharacterized protein n=1 Tax=Prunus dulcis TaxID=3755 RepID=A0AAD4ZUJ5_PRUDU|nr:hypothetical protein L3X38_007390 [Prunus dulcis]
MGVLYRSHLHKSHQYHCHVLLAKSKFHQKIQQVTDRHLLSDRSSFPGSHQLSRHATSRHCLLDRLVPGRLLGDRSLSLLDRSLALGQKFIHMPLYVQDFPFRNSSIHSPSPPELEKRKRHNTILLHER